MRGTVHLTCRHRETGEEVDIEFYGKVSGGAPGSWMEPPEAPDVEIDNLEAILMEFEVDEEELNERFITQYDEWVYEDD